MTNLLNLIPLLAVAIGLSAACGFRVFLPPLILGLAGHWGIFELNPNFQWLTSPVAITIFSLASFIEILGYYIPWVDNLLDAIATPAAILTGTLLTTTLLSDYDPSLKWSLGMIVGGGVSGVVQFSTVAVRATSTGLTAGLGNSVIATLEALLSTLFVFVAILLPILAIIGLAIFLYIVVKTGTFIKGRLKSN